MLMTGDFVEHLKLTGPEKWIIRVVEHVTLFSDSYMMVIFGDLNDRAKNPPLWSGRIESKSGMQHHATVRKCKKHILRSPPSGSIWILMASIQYTWVRFLTCKQYIIYNNNHHHHHHHNFISCTWRNDNNSAT